MTLEHVQARGNRKVYRRRVPKELQAILGKKELILKLGRTEAEVRKRYDEVHASVERGLAKAWDELHSVKPAKGAMSARELFDQAVARALEMGVNPYRAGGDDGPDDPELIEREVIRDAIAAKYPRDPETDHPIGVTPEDTALVRLLGTTSAPKPPSPTLQDAKRRYLKDRFAKNKPGPHQRKKDEQQAERVVKHVIDALGYDPVLAEMRRADARDVAHNMLKVIPKAATVDRYLNSIRAIVNHAIREFELVGVRNQFEKLDVISNEEEPDRRKRLPFTDEQLKAATACIAENAKTDLQHIWRLLAGTGCRLSEIAGLRTADVLLDVPYPHIDVEWHSDRRVKAHVSRRKVPLVGDALVAAREAVAAAGDNKMLFPAYGRPGGGDSASGALGGHVRAAVPDKKVTTHSLRHRMEDLLVIAWVPDKLKRSIMGHSGGGSSDSYGGEEARLKVATEAMEKALGLIS